MLQQEMDNALTWGVGILLIVLALLLVLPMWRRRAACRRVEERIARLGQAQLRNVFIDDGVDGKLFIERLLLGQDAILLLTQNWRNGNIFGGGRIDVWAQVVGKRTRRFNNPLYAVGEAVATLKFHVGGVPVAGKVLFSGDCRFPKGKPENVLTLDDLPAFEPEPCVPSANLQAAWDRLAGLSEPAPNPEIYTAAPERQRGRVAAAVLVLLLGVAWMAGRLWLVLH